MAGRLPRKARVRQLRRLAVVRRQGERVPISAAGRQRLDLVSIADALFVSQGHHRIDTTGAPGGNQASECAETRQQGYGADERQ